MIKRNTRQLASVAAGAFCALAFTAGMGQATADHSPPTTSPAEGKTITLNMAPQPVRWAEDSLPPELYLWLRAYDAGDGGTDLVGPQRADRWARESDQRNRKHTGCWAAVADTTLIMCPDGFIAYS